MYHLISQNTGWNQEKKGKLKIEYGKRIGRIEVIDASDTFLKFHMN